MAKRILGVLLTLTLLLPILPASALGVEEPAAGEPAVEQDAPSPTADAAPEEGVSAVPNIDRITIADLGIDEADIGSNEELFAGWVEKQLGAAAPQGRLSVPAMRYGSMGEIALRDYPAALSIYGKLKEGLAKIANGEIRSTEISITLDTPIPFTVNSGEDEYDAVTRTLSHALGDVTGKKGFKIFFCLLADCSYELYWFDKTPQGGLGITEFFSSDENCGIITSLKFYFTVSDDYRAYKNNLYVVSDKVKDAGGSVAAAKNKIQDIIGRSAAVSSTIDKLRFFRDEICALTSYNHTAANSSSAAYGDPWQLIWVFDSDPGTKVVCEGYSKAFAYLCELAAFPDDVKCYTVTGMSVFSSGSGEHMWNIVSVNGQNHMVDLTNDDSNPLSFFMLNADDPRVSGKSAAGYTVSYGGGWVKYTYDENTRSIYEPSVLTLSNSPRSYSVALELPAGILNPHIWIDGVEYTADISGNTATITIDSADATNAVVCSYSEDTAASKEYPLDMYVWLLTPDHVSGRYTAERKTCFDNILKYQGSSIRYSEQNGIRMITGVPTDVKAALTGAAGYNGYRLEEYGTLVAWVSEKDGPLVFGKSYTKSAAAYKRISNTDPIYETKNGFTKYTNVLINFTNEKCIPELAMRPYIKLTDSGGKTLTLYGGIVNRSIGYIAYQNRNAFMAGSSAYTFIWDIIKYVYGTIYDSEYISE